MCSAHVAIMTFGLVALLGAWHDPVQVLCYALSWEALVEWCALALLVFNGSRIAAPIRWQGNSAISERLNIEDCSARRWLKWIQRANHLCVPPPPGKLNRFVYKGNFLLASAQN